MKEKPKNWIVKLTHRPHGNADKQVTISFDAAGKRTVREDKVDAEIAEVRSRMATEEGYYCGEKAWQMVTKGEAERLSHKDANRILGRMKRLGYSATMENV